VSLARVGKRFYFDYPNEFVTLPKYDSYRGKPVKVLRRLTRKETDFHMFEIQAKDGHKMCAFADELTREAP
jgi:hypothetical protein